MNTNPDGLLKKRLRAIRDKLDFLKHQGASPNKKNHSQNIPILIIEVLTDSRFLSLLWVKKKL